MLLSLLPRPFALRLFRAYRVRLLSGSSRGRGGRGRGRRCALLPMAARAANEVAKNSAQNNGHVHHYRTVNHWRPGIHLPRRARTVDLRG